MFNRLKFLNQDDSLACLALLAASKAGGRGEVPVGAVLCDPVGRVVSEAGNQMVNDNDPLGHAELRAMRQGGERLHNYRFAGCRLVVTLEPCAMCVGALETARLFLGYFLADSNGDKRSETRRCLGGVPPFRLRSGLPFREAQVALLRFFFEERR